MYDTLPVVSTRLELWRQHALLLLLQLDHHDAVALLTMMT
jgi:hypothetical protein